MAEANPVRANSSLLSGIQRRSAVAPQRIRLSRSEGYLPAILDANESAVSLPLCELSHQKSLEADQTLLSSNNETSLGQDTSRILSPSKYWSPANDQRDDPKQSVNFIKRLMIRTTTKQKVLCALFVIFLLIAGIIAGIVAPVYIYVINQPPPQIQGSFTNLTASVCAATTCIGQETPYHTTMVTAIFPFDGSYNDLSGYASGTAYGSSLPGMNTPCYVGISALNLNTGNQYILIPYINFGQNFTIEVWLYPTVATLSSDYGIFSQCDSNSKCLSLSIRSGRFTLSFDSMNSSNITLSSSSLVTSNDWTHLTVAYSATLLQQQIYINGLVDAISNGKVAPYAGTSSGSITTIGRSTSSAYGFSYFTGRIDQMIISAGAIRTPCEIYNDATLLAYYPFNPTMPYDDYSVNLYNGQASGVSLVPHGIYGQALYFSLNTSFFQAPCWPSMATPTVPFSVSLWIKPDNNTPVGGSVVHVSSLQNGSGVCYDLLSLSAGGALIVQLMQAANQVNATMGPIIQTSVWTHVAVVFGTTNGLRIYINGLLTFTSTSVLQNQNGVTTPQYVILGNNSPFGPLTGISCRNGSIPVMPGLYRGAIDEFRMYSRELNSEEVCVLAGL